MQMPKSQHPNTLGYGLGVGVWIMVWDFSHVVRDVKTLITLHYLQVGNRSYTRVEKATDPVQSVPLSGFMTLDKSHQHSHR